MLPAFHRERIARGARTSWARRPSARSRAGATARELDLYAWTRAAGAARRDARAVRLRRRPSRASTPRDFERALGFYGARLLAAGAARAAAPRGRAMGARAAALDGADLRARSPRRRRDGRARRGRAVAAARRRDEEGPLSDRTSATRSMTLLFAGHDTTTSTVAFLFYELARHPEIADAVAGRPAAARPGARRDAAPLPAGLDRPAPRRARRSSSAATGSPRARRSTTARGPRTGCPTCGRSPTRSARSASHPRRASASPRAPTSRSAAGSRICLGMRFGQAEIRRDRARGRRALPRRVAARLPAPDPPDADARPGRWTSGANPGVGFAARKSFPRVKEDLDGRPRPDNGDRERAGARGRGRAAHSCWCTSYATRWG